MIFDVVPRDGDGGNAAGLGDANDSRFRVATPAKHLRKLRAFSRTCLTDDYDHRILFHCFDDFLFELDDWKVRHG